ncbi:hypothetical protein [Haliovirga abyssi]|uniref:Uncharacterized protein n=1 Tax=Haliovirga abyssi TaxID=2996794 RepID=A0AAU9DBM3_9FUSO|nr:hypothetical protein [Haliovirga abyssi]BDU50856.1 hypothetical protein HLVA_14250 [Haliovirga abyssi]
MTKTINIKDNELLTFNNLANLEWQFLSIFNSEKKISDNQSTLLKDLLTPESFVREYDDKKTKKIKTRPVYGNQNEQLDKTQALIEMRKSAGIGMEYLSKLDSVGKFLGEWEVIYGGDKYKIVSEYLTKNMSDYVDIYATSLNEILEKSKSDKDNLDNLEKLKTKIKNQSDANFNKLLKALEENNVEDEKNIKKQLVKDLLNLPSREKVEQLKKSIQILEMTMFIVSNVPGNIMPAFFFSKVGGTEAKFFGSGIKTLLKESLEGASDFSKYFKKFTGELSELMRVRFNNSNKLEKLMILSDILFDKGSYFTFKGIDAGLNALGDYEKNNGKVSDEKNLGEITLTEELDMFDDGFRVFVLKKGEDILIISKNIEDNKSVQSKKALPKNLDYLRIVYNKIKDDNPGSNILLSGLDNGADISFVTGILTERQSKLYYSNPPKNLIDFINFTTEDIKRDYSSTNKIVITGLESYIASELYATLCYSVLEGGTPYLIVLGLDFVLSVISGAIEIFEDIKIRKLYSELLSKEIIDDENSGIKGYITNRLEKSISDGTYNFAPIDYLELYSKTAFDKLEEKKDNTLEYKDNKNLRGHNSNELLKFEMKHLIVDRYYLYKYIKDNKGEYKLKECKYIYEGLIKGERDLKNKKYLKIEIPLKEANSEGYKLYSLLKLIKDLQRRFLHENNLGEVVYIENEKSKIGKLKEIMFVEKNEEQIGKIKGNEYLFLPWLDKQGNIGQELQKGYMASILKSVLLLQIVRTDPAYRGYGEVALIERYGEKDYKIELNFKKLTVEEYLKKMFFRYIIKATSNITTVIRDMREIYKYNYATKIKDILSKEGLSFLDNYCTIEHINAKKSVIKFEEKKDELNYAYNPLDKIIGGTLEIDATDLEINKEYLQSYLKGLLKYLGINSNKDISELTFFNIYSGKYCTTFISSLSEVDTENKIEEFISKDNFFSSLKELKSNLKKYPLKELIGLKVKKGEATIILGNEKDEKKVKVYNKELGIDNKEKEITLKITTPSKYFLNIERDKPNNDYELYSSLGYKDKYYDIRNMGKNSKVTADGKDISGTYKGKDKEESMVKDKINRDTGCKYYGDNLILIDRNLRYYYGDNLDDYLTISNYMEGYLGIDLVEKPKEKKEDLGKGFMDYQVKIKGIKYVNLLNLEIIKEVNEHTVAEIEGIIAGEDTDEVTRFLNVEKQGIEILYGDDNKPIFRGLIYEHSMEIEQNSCKVKIKSYSLSKELEKEKRNRVYHNLGTKYEDVISKLNETYQNKYSFGFNSHIDKQELITELNPVEVQYKESDWDFLKRILRRENDLIIVDDSKGKNPKTVAGIAIGEFGSSQKTIDNKNLLLSRKMKKGVIENSYKLKGYPQIKGEELFSIGNPYNINIDVNTGKQDSLLLIKNRIYKEGGVLKSDLVFVRRDEFNIGVVKREESITGLTLKGTIKKVSKQHKAQIEYTEMENEYDESKSYYYPIERMYTGTYFTPEEDTLVEVHFGAEAGEVSIRNVSSKTEDIDNDPDVKVIRTSFGKEVRFDSKSIKITGKDDESYVEITEESVGLTKGEKEIILKDGKIGINNKDSTITMDDKKVNITTGGSAITMKDDKLTLDNGGVGIEIGNGKINLG